MISSVTCAALLHCQGNHISGEALTVWQLADRAILSIRLENLKTLLTKTDVFLHSVYIGLTPNHTAVRLLLFWKTF